ncbi:hypothetical protein PR048_012953 [Dryococelus australis]|uniref:Uncharacterized protein n=1 Tax=Dryococelus australis TaxID=614101 RepID=A0ABQ9HQU4_9NEOP|nr:hypothetical protein PR048_012953 [Dryococelus australis]
MHAATDIKDSHVQKHRATCAVHYTAKSMEVEVNIFEHLFNILIRTAAGARRLSGAVGGDPTRPSPLPGTTRSLPAARLACVTAPPRPAEEADRRCRNILGIRTLGATRELPKFLNDGLRPINTSHSRTACSLWRRPSGQCASEVNYETMAADECSWYEWTKWHETRREKPTVHEGSWRTLEHCGMAGHGLNRDKRRSYKFGHHLANIVPYASRLVAFTAPQFPCPITDSTLGFIAALAVNSCVTRKHTARQLPRKELRRAATAVYRTAVRNYLVFYVTSTDSLPETANTVAENTGERVELILLAHESTEIIAASCNTRSYTRRTPVAIKLYPPDAADAIDKLNYAATE